MMKKREVNSGEGVVVVVVMVVVSSQKWWGWSVGAGGAFPGWMSHCHHLIIRIRLAYISARLGSLTNKTPLKTLVHTLSPLMLTTTDLLLNGPCILRTTYMHRFHHRSVVF
jgi:hypothetical protein